MRNSRMGRTTKRVGKRITPQRSASQATTPSNDLSRRYGKTFLSFLQADEGTSQRVRSALELRTFIIDESINEPDIADGCVTWAIFTSSAVLAGQAGFSIDSLSDAEMIAVVSSFARTLCTAWKVPELCDYFDDTDEARERWDALQARKEDALQELLRNRTVYSA